MTARLRYASTGELMIWRVTPGEPRAKVRVCHTPERARYHRARLARGAAITVHYLFPPTNEARREAMNAAITRIAQ